MLFANGGGADDHLFVRDYIVWQRRETMYRRLGFECVVKRLRMVLYKPDCDSNENLTMHSVAALVEIVSVVKVVNIVGSLHCAVQYDAGATVVD